MATQRVECRQYTILIGLVQISQEYVDPKAPDLINVKERLMRKVLNINNYIKSLCDYYDRHSADSGEFYPTFSACNPGAQPKRFVIGASVERLLGRNEFFVYSASVKFNPKVTSLEQLRHWENKEGGGVVTITAKLPTDKEKQHFYLKLMLMFISKHAIVLKMHQEEATPATFVSTTVGPSGATTTSACKLQQQRAANRSSSLRYFDDADNDDAGDGVGGHHGPAKGKAYSFFNQSTMFLAKYATSNLAVPGEDEKYVSQRLAREKQKHKRTPLRQT